MSRGIRTWCCERDLGCMGWKYGVLTVKSKGIAGSFEKKRKPYPGSRTMKRKAVSRRAGCFLLNR